jgi:hypothetical protein
MAGWDDAVPVLDGPKPAAEPAEAWDAAVPEAGAFEAAAEMPGDEALTWGAITLAETPDAEGLLQELRALPPVETARLNAAAVVHLSVPALQVMLCAMTEMAGQGRPLVIQDPSFALNLAFETFGFTGANEPFTVEYT